MTEYEKVLENIKQESLNRFASDYFKQQLEREYEETITKILKLQQRLLEIEALRAYRRLF